VVDCEGVFDTPFVMNINSLIPKIFRGKAKCLMVTQWMTVELQQFIYPLQYKPLVINELAARL
jgi:hypothetical protein